MLGSLVFTTLPGIDDNLIDLAIARNLRRLEVLNVSDDKKLFWQAVIEKVILNLSDQQLLAGIAILVSGLIQHCSISVYYFTVISDLPWFSSYVHVTALSVLRDFLSGRPHLRNWRVCLMLVMFVLLLAYTVMEGHEEWDQSWTCPAQCVFDDLMGKIGGSPAMWMWINVVLLVTTYSSATLSLYQGLPDTFISWAYNKSLNRIRAGLVLLQRRRTGSPNQSSSMVLVRAGYMLLTLCLTTIEAAYVFVAAMICSEYLDFLFGLGWILYGLWALLGDRKVPQSDMDGNEDDMTFGQLVPLLLLSSTLVTFKEAYDGKRRAYST